MDNTISTLESPFSTEWHPYGRHCTLQSFTDIHKIHRQHRYFQWLIEHYDPHNSTYLKAMRTQAVYKRTSPPMNVLNQPSKLLPPQACPPSYQTRLVAQPLLHHAAIAEPVAHLSEAYPTSATSLKMQRSLALLLWLLRVSERNPKVVNAELPKPLLCNLGHPSLGPKVQAFVGRGGALVAFQSSKPVFQGPSTSYIISSQHSLLKLADRDIRHVFRANAR